MFKDAEIRIARASDHLTDIKAILNGKPYVETVPVKSDPSDPKVVHQGEMFGHLHPYIDSRIGDVANDLRTALDYMVNTLAIIDSGEQQKGVQFLIEDKPDVFRGKRKTFLKGLSDEHIAAIEVLQPCNGCQWTKRLAQLSNRDKHVELTKTSMTGKFDFAYHLQVNARIGVAVGDVQMETQFTGTVSFLDGTPVIETLEELKAQVTHVLQEFKARVPNRFVE